MLLPSHLSMSLDFLPQVLVAAVLGGLIGIEREMHGQFAGFRTNLLVSVGACLLMNLSMHLADAFPNMDATSPLRVDPGRIASYAVASMGFLGAGAIIKGKGTVRGLTTAAGLWLVTGVGLAVGAGFYVQATMATALCLLVLYGFLPLKERGLQREYAILELHCDCGETSLKAIRSILSGFETLHILFVNYSHDLEKNQTVYRLRLYAKSDLPWGRVIGEIKKLPGLKRIAWLESDVP